jgi:mannosyltransferase OCH1-like enzyme
MNKVPIKMKECIYTLITMNPECDYYLYSDEASLEYLKEDYDEEVVSAFNSLKPGAYKSDLWRYCILYKRGGIYLDIKLQSVKPLVPIIEANPTIFVRDWPGSCTEELGIYNAFMVSPPNNPIFKYCIDDIVKSCKLKLYKNGVLDITGPCLLGQMIKEHNSLEHIQKLPFKMIWFNNPPTNDVEIQYNGDVIVKSYKEYRAEQKSFQKAAHYSQMWMNRDVYA